MGKPRRSFKRKYGPPEYDTGSDRNSTEALGSTSASEGSGQPHAAAGHVEAVGEELVELYLSGLVCDSGIRRDGEIAWVARVHCDRCAGQRLSTPGLRSPDRLPCDDGLRSMERVRATLHGLRN